MISMSAKKKKLPDIDEKMFEEAFSKCECEEEANQLEKDTISVVRKAERSKKL